MRARYFAFYLDEILRVARCPTALLLPSHPLAIDPVLLKCASLLIRLVKTRLDITHRSLATVSLAIMHYAIAALTRSPPCAAL